MSEIDTNAQSASSQSANSQSDMQSASSCALPQTIDIKDVKLTTMTKAGG